MTPKLTVLRYVPRENKAPLPTGCYLGKSAPLLTEPFCHQEEVRICTTTVFVDPYEEADAQVSKVGPEKGTKLVMSLLVRSRRTHPEALDLRLPSLLAGGEKTQLWALYQTVLLLPHRLPRSGRRHSTK